MLSRFKGLPNYAWLTQTLKELKVRFGLEGTAKDSVAYAHNDRLVGLEWFEPLFEAINKKQVVAVKYKGFTAKGSRFTVNDSRLRVND